MEFPHLGENCALRSCNRLDFLPMKCGACLEYFCSDHFAYTSHECPAPNNRDVQVPSCPLCGVPVPGRRGEAPDVAVGEHINNQCKSDLKRRKKVYINRCALKGCDTKEMVPVVCSECSLNFCLKHRHTMDHACEVELAAKRRQAAEADMARMASGQSKKIQFGTPIASNLGRSRLNAVADVQGNVAYTNCCALKGCNTKEMVPVVCRECSLNFCLNHRHMADHACEGELAAKRRQAAEAALARMASGQSKKIQFRTKIASNPGRSRVVTLADVKGKVVKESESEMLARTLSLSMESAGLGGTEAAVARELVRHVEGIGSVFRQPTSRNRYNNAYNYGRDDDGCSMAKQNIIEIMKVIGAVFLLLYVITSIKYLFT